MRPDSTIPQKANKILNLILLAFLLILIRVWYLSFVQRDYHLQQARKPQRKTILNKVERATIRDRFNLPLAHNQMQYTASVRYADLRQLPAYQWEQNEQGVKTKRPVRAAYISSLASLLAKELSMNAEAIEDIIYAKATLFPQTPFIVKEDLTEKQYYRLRMLQKDWLGIEAERVSKRVYPQEKTACDLIGYMGAITQKEYLQIAEEIKELQNYVTQREAGELVFLPKGYEDPLEVRKRLKLLQEKSYTINDRIGKSGIEASFDELLRGVHGKTLYEINPQGNLLYKLPGGKKGISGQRVFLSISSELQQLAEELLANHEAERDLKDKQGRRIPGTPWIKGGAVVAMDPKTGDILALASYPRFNPNDFIAAQDVKVRKEKQKSIHQWLENEAFIGSLWDGTDVLTKETFSLQKHLWTEESLPLTWDVFLSTILPPGSAPLQALHQLHSMQQIYLVHKHFETLLQEIDFYDPMSLIQTLYANPPHIPCKKNLSQEQLDLVRGKLLSCSEGAVTSLSYLHSVLSKIPHNDDKLLVLDLTRLLMIPDLWDPVLLQELGALTPTTFLQYAQSLKLIQDHIKEKIQSLHHELGFKKWKDKHFKSFIAQKRKEEKEKKKPTLPYTDYLEKTEKALFKIFWKACRPLFLQALIQEKLPLEVEKHPELLPYFQSLLSDPNDLFAFHLSQMKVAFSSLPPESLRQALKLFRSFEELDRPLYGKYHQLRHLKGVQLEKHLAASFYPLAGFGYGRSQAFRQSTTLGSVFKVVVGYEALKERYHYLEENHLSLHQLNPLTLVDSLQKDTSPGSLKQTLGYTLDGHPIRRRYKGGILPRSSHANIGKVDFLGAIEQSSNIYFSILAAEHIEDPSLLEKAAYDLGFGSKTGIDLQGEIAGSIPSDLSDNKTGLYSFAIGQHSLVVTPLQTAVMLSTLSNQGKVLKPQVIHLTAGKKVSEDPFSFLSHSSYPFQEPLLLAGINFPLFTESLTASYSPLIHEVHPEIKRMIPMPAPVQKTLLEGMNQVIWGHRGTARPAVIHYLYKNPAVAKDYKDLKGQFVGKTGTAEILYKQWLDAESLAKIHNHIWFGGVLFPEGTSSLHQEDAELVVVVYLRFSEAGGKEAAPIAAQMGKKWRELQKKHQGKSYLERMSSISKKVAQNRGKASAP